MFLNADGWSLSTGEVFDAIENAINGADLGSAIVLERLPNKWHVDDSDPRMWSIKPLWATGGQNVTYSTDGKRQIPVADLYYRFADGIDMQYSGPNGPIVYADISGDGQDYVTREYPVGSAPTKGIFHGLDVTFYEPAYYLDARVVESHIGDVVLGDHDLDGRRNERYGLQVGGSVVYGTGTYSIEQWDDEGEERGPDGWFTGWVLANNGGK